jgi:hypothetical protein
MAKELQRLSD